MLEQKEMNKKKPPTREDKIEAMRAEGFGAVMPATPHVMSVTELEAIKTGGDWLRAE